MHSRFHEPEQRDRRIFMLNEASPHLVGDLLSHIPGPAFSGVEGHYADRDFILSAEQVTDSVARLASDIVPPSYQGGRLDVSPLAILAAASNRETRTYP